MKDLEKRECLCEICNTDYPVWFAPNKLWNKVMRGGEVEKYNFVCMDCFAREAEEQGIIPTAWRLTPENTRFDSAQTTDEELVQKMHTTKVQTIVDKLEASRHNTANPDDTGDYHQRKLGFNKGLDKAIEVIRGEL